MVTHKLSASIGVVHQGSTQAHISDIWSGRFPRATPHSERLFSGPPNSIGLYQKSRILAQDGSGECKYIIPLDMVPSRNSPYDRPNSFPATARLRWQHPADQTAALEAS